MYWCMELFLFSPRTLYFPLLSFMMFLSAHFSSLLISLWMVALLSAASTTPPTFVSCANLLRMRSIIQVISRNFKQCWLHIDPWRIPLVSCFQQDFVPLIAVLWDSFNPPTHFSQLSIHLDVHSSSLPVRMLWETYLAKIKIPYLALAPYPTSWSFDHRRWSHWLDMTSLS